MLFKTENKVEGEIEITQEQFQSYVDVQRSGVTNMFDVNKVMEITGLERDKIIDIMKHYNEYKQKYNPQGEYNG